MWNLNAVAGSPSQKSLASVSYHDNNEDSTYIKHGLKAIDIKRQVQHHDLENDTDV